MAGKVILDNIRGKWTTLPITTVDLRGRTVIITGGNTGLGLETAKMLYKMNPAKLIITARAMDKGEAARQEILKLSGTGGKRVTTIEVWKLDLADFASVKTFANKCNVELDRLDIFLSNAGCMSGPWETTKDGWELGLQVNVIATYMLCALVIPLLSKTAKLPRPIEDVTFRPHLVVVSSALHGMAKFPERNASDIFQALNNQTQYRQGDRYNTTKMLDLLLTRELAKSPAVDPGVVVCSVNPSFCRSELMRDTPKLVQIIMYALMARTTVEGAKTFVWACLADDIPPGAYSSNARIEGPMSFAATQEGTRVQKKAWSELGSIIVKIAPEASAVWAV